MRACCPHFSAEDDSPLQNTNYLTILLIRSKAIISGSLTICTRKATVMPSHKHSAVPPHPGNEATQIKFCDADIL